MVHQSSNDPERCQLTTRGKEQGESYINYQVLQLKGDACIVVIPTT